MMKNVKTAKFDTHLCHVLPFHYDVKTVFLYFLPFKGTESSGQVIFLMLEWQKHPDHLC